MPGKPVVAIPVQGNILFPVLQGANDPVLLPITHQQAIQPETIGLVPGILPLVAAEIALGEAEVVNGVQQVGLAAAIPARNAYNAPVKTEGPVRIVLELGERYVTDC